MFLRKTAAEFLFVNDGLTLIYHVCYNAISFLKQTSLERFYQ